MTAVEDLSSADARSDDPSTLEIAWLRQEYDLQAMADEKTLGRRRRSEGLHPRRQYSVLGTTQSGAERAQRYQAGS